MSGTYDKAAADRVVKFFSLLKHSDGEWAGKPFKLEPWQEHEIIRPLFGTLKADGTRQYRTAFIALARKNGKALDLDTKIYTTEGWTTMGDIREGMQVYAPDGSPTTVVATSEVIIGDPCYRITFSDGQQVICNASHLWSVHDQYLKRQVVVDTDTIHSRYIVGNRPSHNERRYRVDVASPLQTPDVDLPLDPYMLGVWLGDGSKGKGQVTTPDVEIIQAFESAGYQKGAVRGKGKARSVWFKGLHKQLKAAGVFRLKHIPEIYMNAGTCQRMSLLQGLMDSDGHVAKGPIASSARCEFTTIKEDLALQVLQLARSLGFKATLLTGDAMLNGRSVSDKFRITFTAYISNPPFRLKRHIDRLQPEPAKRNRSRSIHIIDVSPVESVPTRCIQVEHPTGCFLVGSGFITTHNSALIAGCGLYMMMADKETAAEVYSAAGDREQAAVIFKYATRLVNACEPIANKVQIYDSQNNKRIVYPAKSSFYNVLSSVAGTKHGLNTHCTLFDELHVQKTPELYDTLRTSTGARRQPLLMVITTAGYDTNSICYEEWMYADQVRRGIIDDPSWFVYIRQADEDGDWQDPEQWKKANPALGSFKKYDYMEAECNKAKNQPSYLNTFKRLDLNLWTGSQTRFIPELEWRLCNHGKLPDLHGRDCYMGVDLSSTSDIAALMLLFKPQDSHEPWHLLPCFYLPADNIEEKSHKAQRGYVHWAAEKHVTLTPGNVIDYDFILNDIRRFKYMYSIRKAGVDPWNGTGVTKAMVDMGIETELVGQTFSTLSAPTKELERMVMQRSLNHQGNPILTWMADNAMAIYDNNMNVRLSKKASKAKIDGIAALVNAIMMKLTDEGGDGSNYYANNELLVL